MKIKNKKNNPYLWLRIILFVFAFIFLITNIYASQNISPLYKGLINNEKEAVINYLKKIKNQFFFENELKNFTQIFNQPIAQEVFFEDEQKKIKIKKLEEALKKNPKSRDLLFALSKLYKEKGDFKMANFYLKKAKEIDPMIK